MQKKIWYITYLLVTIIIVFVVLPYFLGILVESKCKKFAEVIASDSLFEVKITEYRRSWFSAKAQAVVTLAKDHPLQNHQIFAKLPAAMRQLNVVANIHHGLVIFGKDARFKIGQAEVDAEVNLTDAENALLKRSATAWPIAKAKMFFGITGRSKTVVVSDPLAYADHDYSFNWRGLKFVAEFSPLFDQIDTRLDFVGGDFTSKDYALTIAGVTNSYSGHEIAHHLWVGERDLLVKSFLSQALNQKSIAINGLNFHSLYDEDKSGINEHFVINVDTVAVNGTLYKQNNLQIAFNKLDKNLLLKHRQIVRQLLQAEKVAVAEIGQYLDTVLALTNDGAEVVLNKFATITPWGKINIDAHINFGEQPKNNNWLAVLANLAGEVNASADRKLLAHLVEQFFLHYSQKSDVVTPEVVTKSDMVLTKLQQSGWLQEVDGIMQFKFRQQQGQKALINDKPFAHVAI